MRIVSESTLWKKITAAICMVALLVTSFYFVPNERVEARENSVSSIRLKAATGITWCDNGGYLFAFGSEIAESGGYFLTYSKDYRFKKDGNDIILYPLEDSSFDDVIQLYIDSKAEPNVSSEDNITIMERYSNGLYLVMFSLGNANGGEVTITPSPTSTYNVTFPKEEGYSVSSREGGNTIESGGFFDFYVKPTTGYSSSILVESDYGTVEHLDGNLYRLTLGADTIVDKDSITISLKNTGKEVFDVVYQNGTGYTIVKDNGDPVTTEKITYGEQLKFQVVPESGYEVTNVYVNNLPVAGTENEEGAVEYVIESVETTTVVSAVATQKTFYITPPTNMEEGYTFIRDGSTDVHYNENYSFRIITQSGYNKPTVYAYPGNVPDEESRTDENKLNGANDTYVLNNVKNDMYIDVQSGGKIQYSVEFPEGNGYTFNNTQINGILEEPDGTVEYGSVVSFEVNPKEGYRIISVKKNNTTLSKDQSNRYTFKVEENTVINVTTEIITYTVTTPEPSDAYTFTPGGNPTISHGGNYSFYVNASERYEQPTVSYTMGEEKYPVSPAASNNLYVISGIVGDITIEIEAGELKTQTVHLNPTNGVTFKTSGDVTIDNTSVSVNYGESYSFKIEISPDYSESTPYVTVNNVMVNPGEDGVYTISDIKADQVVSVTDIEKNVYSVTLRQGDGYTLTTTETTQVTAGSSFRFSVSAAAGYDLSGASVYYKTADGDPTEIEAENGYYVIEKVSGNIEVYVAGVSKISFKANHNAVNASVVATEGYDLDKIAYNGSLSFTVTPRDYYELTQVAVNGEVKQAVNGVYTVNNITADVNIQVVTTPKTVITVEYQDAKFGNDGTESFTIEDIQNEKAVIKTPEYDSTIYTFAGWYEADGTSWNSGDLLTEGQIGEPIVLTAKWVLTEKVLESFVTTGTIVATETSQYVVTMTTLLKFADALEESEKAGITIIGYGTLYSPRNFDITDDLKEKVQGQALNGNLNELQSLPIGTNLYNYFFRCKTSADKFNSEGFAMVATSTIEPNQRWGAGWIAIQVPGKEEAIFVYATPEKAEKKIDVEQALADVIDAESRDQASSEDASLPAQDEESEAVSQRQESKGVEEAPSVEETEPEMPAEQTQAEPAAEEAQEEATAEQTQTEPSAEETQTESVSEEAETAAEETQTDSTEMEAQSDVTADGQMTEAVVE